MEYTPVRDIRTLRWADDVLKFPCGVTVSINAEKLKKLFTLFKVPTAADELVTIGKTDLVKGTALQIKNHLT